MFMLIKCLLGPRLYKVYAQPSVQPQTENDLYAPNILEEIGNKIIQGLKVLYSVTLYSTPFLALAMFRWEHLSLLSLARGGAGLGLLLVVALVCRGVGRRLNPTYLTFLAVLTKATELTPPSLKTLEPLRQYDFDFSWWPISFDSRDQGEGRSCVYVDRGPIRRTGLLRSLLMLPCHVIAYILTCIIGKQMVYPGCIHLIQFALDHYLLLGREKMVVEQGGLRHRVVACDGNTIDTMLIDRRRRAQYPNGRTLVVCCEGNAGFYEVGIMTTPIECGYSVLGWNHPGFASSTGAPWPRQEQNAVDAVMQFAIQGLGYKQEDILLYGWSIGGYTCTWAAMNYPQVSGVIADATFDDILPLALYRMPASMGVVVEAAVKAHLNLNSVDQLCQYPGPVTIIRRTHDEIITTDETQLRCNRGNWLLVRLLESRYPHLFTTQSSEVLHRWLTEDPAFQGAIMREWEVDRNLCSALLTSYVTEHSETFPSTIGEDMIDSEKTKLLLYLASKYLVDFNSSHNNPLDPRFFTPPWRPLTDSYVQVD